MTQQTVAVIGSGNIGTDPMIKVLRSSGRLSMGAMVGMDRRRGGGPHPGEVDHLVVAGHRDH
jgi:acetaldehyde dehydrogenase